MKRLIVTALLLIPLAAMAVPRSRKAPRQEDPVALQKIDSLQHMLDSLRSLMDPAVADQIAGKDSSAPETVTYTPEETDSLMNLWYQNTLVNDFSELEDYSSEKFTSDVPDSVFIKRLRDMNSFFTLPFNETVKNYMILYSERMTSNMSRMLGMSAYYMPIFEAAFAKYDLPLELKYMAVIESGLNLTATSRAGARGMWQFMYQTGRSYGLKITSFVDERLDVEKSVDAAARFLRDAYQVFGDWSLAISSYNCGAGNVQKAIRWAGSRNFWDIYPYLPRETRGYVPAFVGAMYAMTYYKEYGIVPENVGMPAATDTFHINRNLHFKQVSKVAGIPEEVLRQFNPQYIHDIVPGASEEYVLKLPYTWTAQFIDADQDSLYAFKAEYIDVMSKENQAKAARIAYKVRKGDNLGKIASRNHVGVSQLKKWNHLKSNTIRVGQVIYIYRNGGPSSYGTRSSASKSSSRYHTVRSGESYYSIAKCYPGVSPQDIMKANKIKGHLKPGMKIKIPAR